jgi:hypothetical protein
VYVAIGWLVCLISQAQRTERRAAHATPFAEFGGKTNRAISDKTPAEYFPVLIAKAGASAFEAQCILTDSGLLGVESYKAFPSKRREKITNRLNEFLGTGPATSRRS